MSSKRKGVQIRNLWIASAVVLMLIMPARVARASDQACIANLYNVVALPLIPTGINDAGQVVGTTDSHKAAVWTKQQGLVELGVPAGFTNSQGTAINNSGSVVGLVVNLRTSSRQGFFYKDGRLRLLPGKNATPFAISDGDVVVGESTVGGNGVSNPVVWMGASLTDLGGCCGGVATGINSRGQIIGNTYDKRGNYSAFLWDKINGMQHIGPPDVYSSALLVNNAGDIVLQEFARGVWLRKDGRLTQLGLSARSPSNPKAINKCGAIVGSSGTFHDYYRGFAWDSIQGFRDLNTLIGSNSDWKLQEATGINSHGEIVGWGEFGKHHEEAGFLLIPQW